MIMENKSPFSENKLGELLERVLEESSVRYLFIWFRYRYDRVNI